MAKMLLEDSWQFQPDRKCISESQLGTVKAWNVPGLFSQCEAIGGNGRRYGRKVWENNILKEESHLNALIRRNSCFGTLEHPKDGRIDYTSPISHLVTEVKLQVNGDITGVLTILETEDGKKLKILIEAGHNPFVSSRGYGNVRKAADGVDEVLPDYVCEAWDVVMHPSYTNAQLQPQRESLEQPTPIPQTGTISSPPGQQLTITVGSPGATGHSTFTGQLADAGTAALAESATLSASTSSIKQPIPTKYMDIKTIRSDIGSLRSVNLAEAAPGVITESFERLTDLHKEITEAQAADPKSSYDCSRLHRELDQLEEAWNTTIMQPRVEVKRLTEDRQKLVNLAGSAVKTAKFYRTQLTETVRKAQSTHKLYEEVATRGRGWKSLADKRLALIEKHEHKLAVATTALDKLVEGLKSGKGLHVAPIVAKLQEAHDKDILRLSKALVEARHKDKLNDDQKKQLTEAKTVDEVATLNEAIEKPVAASAAPVAAPAAPVVTAPAVLAQTAAIKSITEGMPAPLVINAGPGTFANFRSSPSVLESVEIARRLKTPVAV